MLKYYRRPKRVVIIHLDFVFTILKIVATLLRIYVLNIEYLRNQIVKKHTLEHSNYSKILKVTKCTYVYYT